MYSSRSAHCILHAPREAISGSTSPRGARGVQVFSLARSERSTDPVANPGVHRGRPRGRSCGRRAMNWYGGSQETTPVAERCGPILGRTQFIGDTSRLLPHRRRCDALSDYFTITGPGVTFGALAATATAAAAGRLANHRPLAWIDDDARLRARRDPLRVKSRIPGVLPAFANVAA